MARLNEARVKAGLLRYLEEFYSDSSELRIVEELPLNQGRTRADLVVVGPHLLGLRSRVL